MDYGAATPVDPKVLESMMPFFTEHFGNPSSVYSLGFEAKAAIEEAREKVARLVGSPEDGVIFTSSGTESNNLAIRGTAYQFKDKGKHIITSAFEHDSVLKTISSLEGEGFESTQVPVDEEGRHRSHNDNVRQQRGWDDSAHQGDRGDCQGEGHRVPF
jgi:cysteine desulfurase